MKRIQKYEMKIITWDVNAKVRREGIHRHITGRISLLKEINENGKGMIEFAIQNKWK